MKNLFAAAAIVTLWLGAATHAQPAALTDAQKALDAGDYRGSLQTIADALSIREAPLPPEQEYALLMLRGESLLRLNERTYAIDSFDAAMRAAERAGDLKKAAAAKANVVIIQRSQGSAYKPRGENAEPIDITTADSRKRAMRAALEDLLSESSPKIKRALEAKELPPTLELIPVLGDAYVLELTSTGEARRTTDLLKSFEEHARRLMESELTRVSRRVGELSSLANSWITANFGISSTIDRRGLWTPERRELADLIDYTRRIRHTALRARQISKSFGFSGENWDPVIAEANDVLDREEELWEHRY